MIAAFGNAGGSVRQFSTLLGKTEGGLDKLAGGGEKAAVTIGSKMLGAVGTLATGLGVLGAAIGAVTIAMQIYNKLTDDAAEKSERAGRILSSTLKINERYMKDKEAMEAKGFTAIAV